MDKAKLSNVLGLIVVTLGSLSFIAASIVLCTFDGPLELLIVYHFVAVGLVCDFIAFLLIPLQREGKFTNWFRKPMVGVYKKSNVLSFLGVGVLLTLIFSPRIIWVHKVVVVIFLYTALFLIAFGQIVRIRLSKGNTPKNDT